MKFSELAQYYEKLEVDVEEILQMLANKRKRD